MIDSLQVQQTHSALHLLMFAPALVTVAALALWYLTFPEGFAF